MNARRIAGMVVVLTLAASLPGYCQPQAIPNLINYQGKLADGTNLVNGMVSMVFRLWDAPTGTGTGWPFCEDSGTVTVVDGLYSTYIGDNVTFGGLDNALCQTQVWIEVIIGTNVLSPREQMVSAGYSRYASGVPEGAIHSIHIADNSILDNHIVDGEVTESKLADRSVSAMKIGLGIVGEQHIANGALSGAKITDGTISNANLAMGAVTADKVASNTFWQTTGNAGITAGTHFLGTTDDRPVEIYANNQRVMRIDNSFTMPNIVIGESNNFINPLAGSATISGGGGLGGGNPNRVTDNYGTIGGGAGNRAGNDAGSVFDAEYATVGGGENNRAELSYATVAGGRTNVALSVGSAIGGGQMNRIADQSTNAVIAGGRDNKIGSNTLLCVVAGGGENEIGPNVDGGLVGGGFRNELLGSTSTIHRTIAPAILSGTDHEISDSDFTCIVAGDDNIIQSNAHYAVIMGGYKCRILDGAEWAWVAGRMAEAAHPGAFIWADSQNAAITSSAANEVTFRCDGGVRFLESTAGGQRATWAPGDLSWNVSSDRNLKENFEAIDPRKMLEQVARLPVSRWNFKGHEERKHIGPMAQDVHATLGLGRDPTLIDSGDLQGVSLAAIQGLYEQNRELKAEIAELRREIEGLKGQAK